MANAVVVARWSCHVFVTIVYMAIIALSRIRDIRPVSVKDGVVADRHSKVIHDFLFAGLVLWLAV